MDWEIAVNFWTDSSTITADWRKGPTSVLRKYPSNTLRDFSKEIQASKGKVDIYYLANILGGAFTATKTEKNVQQVTSTGQAAALANSKEKPKFRNILGPFKIEWLKKFDDARKEGASPAKLRELSALCRKKANEYVLSHIPSGYTISSSSKKIRALDMEKWLKSPESM